LAKSGNPAVHCGQLVKKAAEICGGNGGGRPDFAQAGAKDPAHIEAALAAIRQVLA